MQGYKKSLVDFMDRGDIRFVIPVYQRNYDWKKENCRQLFNDLINIIREKKKTHFFGCIVSACQPGREKREMVIIDGQQRLTTVSLLFLAMYKLIREGKAVPKTASLPDRLYERYLVDKYQDDPEARIKLKSVKDDRTAYRKLIEGESGYDENSGLTKNYLFFYDEIQRELKKGSFTIDELFDAACGLEIIDIDLDRDDDPQLIFDSLNSTGLALQDSDRIRNFVLMNRPAKQQEQLYTKFWTEIEKNTENETGDFIRDYLIIKSSGIPTQRMVYQKFKEYAEKEEKKDGSDIEKLLSDMKAYSEYSRILSAGLPEPDGLKNSSQDERQFNDWAFRFRHLEATVTRPFFMEVFSRYKAGKMALSDVCEIFLLSESYIFRRFICNIPTNSLNKTFAGLHQEIMRYGEDDADYAERFKYALLSKKGYQRFPNNAEFVRYFTERDIYSLRSRIKPYIFERFENFGLIETKAVREHISRGDYSIEHIMPQKLTRSWEESLGENFMQIHETWLHRIANLTLTAYNSSYSNRPFETKKTCPNGFENSGIRMNLEIAKYGKWSLSELEDRNRKLMERAVMIWPYPSTDFCPPPGPKEVSMTLDKEPEEFKGKKISRFVWKGSLPVPVKSWQEMQKLMIGSLNDENSRILKRIANGEEDFPYSKYISGTENSSRFRKPFDVGGGIYVEGNTNTETKLKMLRSLFDLYGEDPDELEFFLTGRAEKEETGDAE